MSLYAGYKNKSFFLYLKYIEKSRYIMYYIVYEQPIMNYKNNKLAKIDKELNEYEQRLYEGYYLAGI